jgi:serine/threonine protein kinase/tetratricopeptide (TPR) repeat protein
MLGRHETDMIGQSIAHYRIVKEIGSGGMGQVFLAEDTKLDRQVAIKVLLSPNPNESQVARFQREARAAAALNHPNIISIHELGTEGVTSYVVMEWLEGRTLRQRLDDGPPPLPVALTYARDIIQGLVAAHEKGIYHRDLKPENIFITLDGRVKILDFGLAQMRVPSQLEGADSEATGLVTTPGTMIGTTVYMSPEQIRGESADHRADIFAVGLMLFELLTGARAFREPTIVETMHAILKQPAPLDRIDPEVPPAVIEIVRRCLEKQPADRFESARELAMAMQALDPSVVAGRVFAAPTAPRVPVSNSIAVLPFANMSGDAELEYFSDGVSEEVINAIAQVKGLHVAARTSSFAFKGKSLGIQQVGAALNVATVLEGSVRRSGQKLRISAQLIDVANGYQLWSERYDRQLDDVFAIQEDIATHIVQKLTVALTSSAIGAVARPSAPIEAYDLYLKGRYLVEQRGEAIVKGLESFKQAIAVDPGYALAYAGMAEALALLGIYGVVPHARVFPDAKAAAMRAVQLDDRLAEAHNAMALVAVFHDWDWDTAEKEFDRALEINPNHVAAHYWKGLLYYHHVRGNTADALRETEDAVMLDPMAMLPFYALTIVLVNVGRHDEAIVGLEARLARDPAQFLLYQVLGAAYFAAGRYDEAIATLEKGSELSRRHPLFTAMLGMVYVTVGRVADAERIQEELLERAKTSYVSSLSLASVPLYLGRIDEAVQGFERAFADRDPTLVMTPQWMPFKRARRDRRVQQVFERMGVTWTL